MASDTPIDNKVGLQADNVIEFKAPDLPVIPDVGDPGTFPVSEEITSETGDGSEEITTEAVDELYAALEGQNGALIQRLSILGKGINPLMLLKLQIDTLIDFVFESPESRKQYDTACSMRLNEALKITYASIVGADVDNLDG